jgi:hypothetical protein
MKPTEVLDKAMFWVSGLFSRRYKKPGEVIERLSAQDRSVLQNLKSEEISPDVIREEDIFGDDAYYQNKEFQESKLEFDKRMKK